MKEKSEENVFPITTSTPTKEQALDSSLVLNKELVHVNAQVEDKELIHFSSPIEVNEPANVDTRLDVEELADNDAQLFNESSNIVQQRSCGLG